MSDSDGRSAWLRPASSGARGKGPQSQQKLVYGDFAAANRHTSRVRWLRRAFIIVPVVIGLGIFVMTVFDPFRHFPGNISIGRVDIEGSKITVETPNITGLQTNGQPFAIRAAKAVQDIVQPNIVTLTDVNSDLGMEDKSNAHITAETGVYDSKIDRVQLTGRVRIKNIGRYDMRMQRSEIYMKPGILDGWDKVEVLIEDGIIKADSMHLEDNGHHITFAGNVFSHFDSEAPTEAPQAGGQP